MTNIWIIFNFVNLIDIFFTQTMKYFFFCSKSKLSRIVTNCHAFHKTIIIQQVTMLKHVFSHCHELSRIVTLSCFPVFMLSVENVFWEASKPIHSFIFNYYTIEKQSTNFSRSVTNKEKICKPNLFLSA